MLREMGDGCDQGGRRGGRAGEGRGDGRDVGAGTLGDLVDPELGEQARAQLGEARRIAQTRAGELDAKVEREAALGEHEHPVGEQQGFVDVVGDEQHGGAVAGTQLLHQRVHTDAGERIERAERLVEEEQLRLAHERSGERGTLRLAAGQGLRPVVLVTGQADLAERLATALVGAGPVLAEHHVVEDGRPWQEPWVLEHHRSALRNGHVTLGAAVDPGERAKQGALARPAPAEKGHELAGCQRQVDVAQHVARPERSGEPAHVDRQGRLAQSPGCHRCNLRSWKRTSPSVSCPCSA